MAVSFELVWDHVWISGLSILLALILGVRLGIFISFKKLEAGVVIGIVNIHTIPPLPFRDFDFNYGIGNKQQL